MFLTGFFSTSLAERSQDVVGFEGGASVDVGGPEDVDEKHGADERYMVHPRVAQRLVDDDGTDARPRMILLAIVGYFTRTAIG